ncbi:hypothetical protein [Rhizobium sp. MHM7A]|uniref:hypothetical protein n=1 Tax=Rhizobium sp. MHM7A TaxID=2583233 RepID=UPI001105DEFE|nr:hypothetical protein [Rhizobium sp. MHM7A]TLX15833.1 hypothetical protein FFR93_00525 [Rhizobium sp. MHM7A]
MTTFNVTLEKHGFFEVPSVEPMGGSLRVGFNPDYKARPWVILSQDRDGVRWEYLFSYADLDSALAYAVRHQVGVKNPWEYTVNLPCGGQFKRPGRVPVEQVMASMGWMYVTDIIGYGALSDSRLVSVEAARKVFQDRIVDTNVTLGKIDPLNEEKGHWCANYLMTYHGFIHRDELQSELRICFQSEGVAILPDMFDYRCRHKVTTTADVISFEAKRAERLQAA